MVGDWIAQRDADVVIEVFEKAEAAVAPIYTIVDVMTDPHFVHRETIVSVSDSELGQVKMQNVAARLSRTPGSVRWTGAGLGAHNQEVYGTLSPSAQELKGPYRSKRNVS